MAKKNKNRFDKGKLIMEFDREITEFKILKEIENLIENHSVSTVNIMNIFVQDVCEMKEDSMKYVNEMCLRH